MLQSIKNEVITFETCQVGTYSNETKGMSSRVGPKCSVLLYDFGAKKKWIPYRYVPTPSMTYLDLLVSSIVFHLYA